MGPPRRAFTGAVGIKTRAARRAETRSVGIKARAVRRAGTRALMRRGFFRQGARIFAAATLRLPVVDPTSGARVSHTRHPHFNIASNFKVSSNM